MADGLFYVDSRAPHISADVAAVTLTTTYKAIVPIANLPVLGANYFSYVGKAVRLSIFGRLTTVTTPGNGAFALWWGNGTDANGTTFLASTQMVLTANMTSTSWKVEATIRARALGATGSLFGTGTFSFLNSATLTTAASTFMMPPSIPAAQTLDLTQNFVISPQFQRSGSTAESIQVHDFLFEALN